MSTSSCASEQDLEQLANLFRLLSDRTRLNILMLLADGERNVTSLCEQLRLPQPTVSHHLSLLRRGGRQSPGSGTDLPIPQLRGHRRLTVGRQRYTGPTAVVGRQGDVVLEGGRAQRHHGQRQVGERQPPCGHVAEGDLAFRHAFGPAVDHARKDVVEGQRRVGFERIHVIGKCGRRSAWACR